MIRAACGLAFGVKRRRHNRRDPSAKPPSVADALATLVGGPLPRSFCPADHPRGLALGTPPGPMREESGVRGHAPGVRTLQIADLRFQICNLHSAICNLQLARRFRWRDLRSVSWQASRHPRRWATDVGNGCRGLCNAIVSQTWAWKKVFDIKACYAVCCKHSSNYTLTHTPRWTKSATR